MIRPAMILIALLASSLGLTLFIVKYQVQDLEGVLMEYNQKITEDREAIHVLRAEWSHLNQPSRLRKLANRYLGMVMLKPVQVTTEKAFFAEPISSDVPLISDTKLEDERLVMPLTAQSFIVSPKQ
jgi:cell division protein FtsL